MALCQQILLEDSQKTAEDLKKQVLEQIRQCGRRATLLADLRDVSYMSHLRVYAGLFQQGNTSGTSLLQVTPGTMYQSRLNSKLFL